MSDPASANSLPFADQLSAAIQQRQNGVLVGLDPRLANLPQPLQPRDANDPMQAAVAFQRFCEQIIDVVAGLVPAVKPQAAFFERLGPAGMQALANVVQYARQAGLIVLMDAKRGDIGSTAEAYADGFLGADSVWGAHALTVNPYLGDDSLTPFVDVATQRDAGIFVLVKTSNPGGKLFQDLEANGKKLYQHVAEHVQALALETQAACGYGAVGAVVGATYPEELAALRQLMPNAWLLIPGFGSQGGGASDVAAGFDSKGQGALVNSSRAIIFAHQRPEYAAVGADDWQRAVEQATRDMISQLAAVIPSA